MPRSTYSQTFPTISLTASRPNVARSFHVIEGASLLAVAPTFVAYTQPSTHFSSFNRPMTQPASIAMTRPVVRYSAATFQPKSPNKSTSATSLIIGAAIRNENVTPSGTPVVTKPMKRGTAEQEQNGVTTPSSE